MKIIEPIENEIVNILLVDDDEDEYIIARDLFTEISSNYHIFWFSDFDQALDEFRKDSYDICLCDYHMGKYNGIEFIEKAVAINFNTPIILLTGQGDHEIDIRSMKAGAVDYLDKNKLDIDNLGRAVRYALERKKTEQKIKYLAYYDQLTDLPNRTLFLDRVHNTYASAKRYKRIFSIMFLDIDNFKRINDSLGHNIGDLLIKQVSERLLKSVRKEDAIACDQLSTGLDTVARLGGDEFTILLSEINSAENLSRIAERIRDELVAPIEIEDKMINVTVSIGIAIYPNDADDVDTLIKNADIAMYNAKSVGKNSYQYFNSSMNTAASVKLKQENELLRAIENEEFTMYYQPLLDLNTKKIYALEALIRWMHPEKGIVLPGVFINLAEEIELINKLGEIILGIIDKHYNKWKKDNINDVNIAINISPKQLHQGNILDIVKSFTSSSNIPTDKLIIEITESSVFDNTEFSDNVIKSLKDMKIKISLDDFGTGYSSFNTLKKVNLDLLKIDRSFIMTLPDNKEDSTIVASLISIAHCMDLKVVAEGVETEEQLAFLKSKGCDIVQGYLFSRPVPEDKIIEMLKKDNLFTLLK